jgi:lambda repressor-like predicted transcriptional regulator
MTSTIKKRLIKLPPDIKTLLGSITDGETRDDYVRSLRRVGWTLQAISESIGVSRERVRQICEMPDSGTNMAESMPVPTPPATAIKEKKVYIDPSPVLLARALELQPLAQQVRSSGTRFRAEAEEYTRLVNQMMVEGVTLYRLAKQLGVTHGALRFRLTRYGYIKPPEGSTSLVYRPIVEKNRVI